MRGLSWLLLAALPSFALHLSDAGKVDWHKELIGIPRTESAKVAPRFERTPAPNARSLIVTVTTSNVLAAVDSVGGYISWRHVLDSHDRIEVYRVNPGFVITLSGPRGANLRAYETSSGFLIFERQLHDPEEEKLFRPPDIGQDVVFSVDNTSDIFALTNARTLHRVDGTTGEVKWEWNAEDRSPSVLFHKVVSTEESTYILGLQKLPKSYTLTVVSLRPSTGTLLSAADISSGIRGPSDVVVLTSSRSQWPTLAWLGQEGHIHTVILSPESKYKPRVLREDIYEEIRDVGISDAGIFVALKRDGTAHVIRVDQSTQSVKKVWVFEDLVSDSSNNVVYSSGSDPAGQPYVARIHWSQHISSLQLFAPNGAEGQGIMTSFTFDYDPLAHGTIEYFALEVANPQEFVYIPRFMYSTSGGTLQLWKQDKLQWTREESLTEITAVEFVDLPEQKVDRGVLDMFSFIARVLHQISEARNFPSYAARFGRRFLHGSIADEIVSNVEDSGPLWRDAFGFRKALVVATSRGKIFGIDSAHGRIVWSRLLDGEYGEGSIHPFKLFTMATVSDTKQPEIALMAHLQLPSDERRTVLYRFEALTGSNIGDDAGKGKSLKRKQLSRRATTEAYLVRGEKKIIVFVGEDLKVRVYPDDEATRSYFVEMAPSLHFFMENPSGSSPRLSGHRLHSTAENGVFQAFALWTSALDPTDQIQSIIQRPHEPIASIGKVLGDRSTLFKYINPHLVAVTVASQSTPPRCSLHLMDTIKGTVIYHAEVPPAGGDCAIKATLAENWLLYHYYDEGLHVSNGTKGYRMVSVELYEGTGTNDKTRSSDVTSYSYDSSLVTVIQQSFVFPHDVTALTTTSTKYGISTKDLIVATPKQQIQSFPRRFFDPRRPKRKPTAEEQEEWLTEYDPLIPDDPRSVLSHNYKVAGTKKIVASPASLESTSLILAYGLDLFFTRVAPSNTFDILSESFNKTQLVLTAAALALAVAIAKPLARRKQIRERWYHS